MRTRCAWGCLAAAVLLSMPSIALGQETDVQLIAYDGMPVAGSSEALQFGETISPARADARSSGPNQRRAEIQLATKVLP